MGRAAATHHRPRPLHLPHIATWLVIPHIPKAVQEYMLHIAEPQPRDWMKRAFGL
jgi:hypothetical protein